MKQTQTPKKAPSLRYQNGLSLLSFQLFFKLGLLSALIFLASGGLRLCMKLTGFAYLTLENLRYFILNPFTLFFLLLLLLLVVLGTFVDLSAVIYVHDQTRQEARASVPRILLFSLKTALRAWRPGNLILVPAVTLLTPLFNLGLIACVLATISIPEFISDFIAANESLRALVCVALVALYMFFTRYLYALHYFALEDCSGLEALKKSAALAKRRSLADFAYLLINQFLFGVCVFAALLVLIALATGLSQLFSGVFVLRWVTSTVVWIALVLSILFAFALSSAVSFGRMSQLFYRRSLERGMRPPRSPAAGDSPQAEKRLRLAYVTSAWVALAASLCLVYLISIGRLNPPIEYIRATEITAHRGASAYYPENTMAAFRGAVELGADWIELDVQQCKSGEIVVMHDSNARRTTGVNARIWNLTYDQIAALDAGRFFSREFAGERVPLLSQVLEYARETGVKLNIELKPTGHEANLEESVVDLIREYEYEDDCVITSQVYRVLERVKAYDPDITTVYVARLAYGNINQLAAADHFSVEATNVTRRLVSRLHNEGRQIFAWTVNTRDGIAKLIDRNVDNIITDDIQLARQCAYESRYSDLLSEFVKLIQ